MRQTFLTFVLLLGFCGLARADANAEARFFFERGNGELARAMQLRGAARHGGIEAALSSYLQSLRIVRSKNTVYNLAICYEELGQLEDAYEYFAEYLRNQINDAERAEATRRIEVVRPRVALIEVRTDPPGAQLYVDRRDLAARGTTPTTVAVPAGQHTLTLELAGHAPIERIVLAVVGQTAALAVQHEPLPASLSIDVQGSSAEVFVDGVPAGRTPLRVSMAAGMHELLLRRTGAEELRQQVALGPGEERSLRLAMSVLPIPGGIAVQSNVAAAHVSVDGVSWGAASTRPRGIVPGRHTVDVSAAGYRPAAITIDVPEGRAVTVRARLAQIDPPGRHGALPIVTGIGAGVSLLVGAALGVTAIGRQDELDGIRNRPPYDDGERDEARAVASGIDRLNIAADVFGAGALLLGSVTALFLATSGNRGPTESAAEIARAARSETVADLR